MNNIKFIISQNIGNHIVNPVCSVHLPGCFPGWLLAALDGCYIPSSVLSMLLCKRYITAMEFEFKSSAPDNLNLIACHDHRLSRSPGPSRLQCGGGAAIACATFALFQRKLQLCFNNNRTNDSECQSLAVSLLQGLAFGCCVGARAQRLLARNQAAGSLTATPRRGQSLAGARSSCTH